MIKNLVFTLLFIFTAVFAGDISQLTPSQLEMIKSAGYGDYLEKLKKDASSSPQIDKVQVVKNDIITKNKQSFKLKSINYDENQSLPRFGSAFFNNKNTLNPYSIPTPSNYILTKGDKLSIQVYGVNQDFNTYVERDGSITLSNVGKIQVAGLSFEDAKKVIKNKIKNAFPASTDIVISISEFTPIQVIVSGLVKAPGLYNLTSFSTIKDALMQCGGILDSGSYRNILLKRNGKIIKVFDLYKLIRFGDTSDDLLLHNGDILIVKPIQKRITLKGQVNMPGIYELRRGESFKNLFIYSSGLKANANANNIVLKSFINNKYVKVSTLTKKELYHLHPRDGDTVLVSSIDDVIKQNNFTISGEVYLPGTYTMESNSISISKALKLAGGLTKKALKSNCELSRYKIVGDERVREVQNINLTDAISKGFRLKPDDELKIFPIANWNKKEYIILKGEVKHPGKYAINRGEKLASVIQRAGGFTDKAFIEGAVFTRESVKRQQEEEIKKSLSKLKSEALAIKSQGTSIGEDKNSKNKALDYVNQLQKEAEKIKPIGRISIKLAWDMERFKNSPYNITLKNGDSLFIPTMKDTVTVIGQVLNQNTLIYDPKLDIQDYIEKCGGLNETADDDHIYIVKANGEAMRYKENFFNTKSEIFKGDTIVVPMKIEVISSMQFSKDVSDILYKLAVTVASLKTVGAI